MTARRGNHIRRWNWLGCCALVLLLAACRRGGGAGGPTLQPTLTATPRSTALPALPTALPIGSEDNPVRLVIVPPADVSSRSATNAAGALGDALTEGAGFTIQVVTVETQAEAVRALCESVTGEVSAAWLNALGYAAASALDCGSPALLAQADDATVRDVQIYVREAAEITALSGLTEAVVCRVSVTDADSWLIPSLILQAAGVSPTSLVTVQDFDSPEAILDALDSEDCDAAGLPTAAYDEASGTVRGTLQPLGEPVSVPNAVLFYPLELPLGARTTLTDVFNALRGDARSALSTLTGAGDVAAVDEDTLSAFDRFLQSTTLDFAQIGS